MCAAPPPRGWCPSRGPTERLPPRAEVATLITLRMGPTGGKRFLIFDYRYAMGGRVGALRARGGVPHLVRPPPRTRAVPGGAVGRMSRSQARTTGRVTRDTEAPDEVAAFVASGDRHRTLPHRPRLRPTRRRRCGAPSHRSLACGASRRRASPLRAHVPDLAPCHGHHTLEHAPGSSNSSSCSRRLAFDASLSSQNGFVLGTFRLLPASADRDRLESRLTRSRPRRASDQSTSAW